MTQFYEVRGLRLAYQDWGSKEGHPVLMIHGFLDCARSFEALLPYLPQAYRYIAPDLRGHGESGWLQAGGYYHFYDYLDDIMRLVEHLGLNKLTIVGHSLGGSVATASAALLGEAVERLVLLEGMGPPSMDLADTVQRLKSWVEALKHPPSLRGPRPLEVFVARLKQMNPRLDETRATHLAENLTRPEGDGRVWRADPLHRTPAAKPFTLAEAMPLWRAIQGPVLSLWGANTPWRPDRLDERHACLKEVVVEELEECGHNLHHDQPQLLAERIGDWLRHDD